jgi:lipopolysaccharide export system protein LptA
MSLDPHILESGPRTRGRLWKWAVLWLALIQPGAPVHAQPDSAGNKGSNFKISDYYPAPNQTQKKYQLTGLQGSFQPGDKGLLTGGTVLLTTVKLEAFRTNGEPEMVVEAPQCTYDVERRQVSSAGRLKMQSGDGKLRIEGSGFACQMGDKSLIISNNVQATVQPVGTNLTGGPLVVTSRWFEFVEGNRRAVFHDQVRGEDADLQFACGQLSISGSTNQAGFDLVEADGNLEITGKAGGAQAGRHATAQRGRYRRDEQLVELLGDATWQLGTQSGQADHVTARQGDGSFEAEGKVALKLPRATLGVAGGLLSASNAPASTADVSMVNLFANHFRYQSNLVVATGAVRVVNETNQLTCDRLETIPPAPGATNERAIAVGHVVVERGGGGMYAERAEFTKSDGLIVFTGDPGWRQAPVEGRAERVTVKTATEEVNADSQVAVKIQTGKQGGSLLKFFPEAETNHTEQVVEITARTLRVKAGQAIFAGDVQLHQLPKTGSEARMQSEVLEVHFAKAGSGIESIMAVGNIKYEMGLAGVVEGPAKYRELTCRTLTARSDPGSGELSQFVAEGQVRIEQSDSVARGDQVVYNRTTDTLRLIGQPSIETARVTYTSGQELIWDRARQTVKGSDYKLTPKPGVLKPDVLKRAVESGKLP